MLITLITPDNRHRFSPEMEAIFRLRHQAFNEWMGWNLPHQNGLEYDKYDPTSLHILATDMTGEIVGTWRTMPTTSHYMTADIFPELLVETGIISAPEVWDLSRFAISRPHFKNNKAAQMRLIAAMSSALHEFGILNGITEYLSVQNNYITPIANQVLGSPTWHSQTIDAGATEATCYSYTPSMEKLYSLRTHFQLASPILSQFQITTRQAA